MEERHRPGVGGEIQIGSQTTENRVPNGPSDEVQLVARGGEQRTEFGQHLALPVERDGGSRQQFGVLREFGHVR